MRTADGSFTLDSPSLREHYHSLHGALTESRHVYICKGLAALGRPNVSVLEVGLGTGLNALLTWMACRDGGPAVDYLALEPCPLPELLHNGLDHAAAAGRPELAAGLADMLSAPPDTSLNLGDGFRFRSVRLPVQQLDRSGAFDLVYFDAFAPGIQPGMWTVDVFHRVYRAMRPGAVLVTYCAKGEVRRTMQAAGLQVERLQGPPGKRHMLRATRTP